jgi:hypothetical protein
MPKLLHILTRPKDELFNRLLQVQESQPNFEVVVVDLTAPEPDYEALVRKVFEADSIATW